MNPSMPNTPDAIAEFRREVWTYTALVVVSSLCGSFIASAFLEHHTVHNLSGRQEAVIIMISVAYLLALFSLIRIVVRRCNRLEVGPGKYVGLILASIFILFPLSLIWVSFWSIRTLTAPTSSND